MAGRFDYLAFDETAQQAQSDFKSAFRALENDIEKKLLSGRARSLALTALEETYMWVGKAIRDDQVLRHSVVAVQQLVQQTGGVPQAVE